MATEQTIGKWQFSRNGSVELKYRLSRPGMIPGLAGLALLFALPGFGACTQLLNPNAGSDRFVLGGVLLAISLIGAVGFIGQIRLRVEDHVLSARLDHFRRGDTVLCALSEIREITISRTEANFEDSETRTRTRHVSYRIAFALSGGGSVDTYLGDSQVQSERQAALLRDFLVARGDHAVSIRNVGF